MYDLLSNIVYYRNRKQVTAQTAYDRESKKLTNLSFSAQVDKDLIRQQTEKTRRLLHEKETINKEVDFDQDKLCSKLLSLVSRENRYAASVLQLMKIKQQFYEVAFQTINAELPNLEGMHNVFAEFFSVLRYVTSKEIRSKNTK